MLLKETDKRLSCSFWEIDTQSLDRATSNSDINSFHDHHEFMILIISFVDVTFLIGGVFLVFGDFSC